LRALGRSRFGRRDALRDVKRLAARASGGATGACSVRFLLGCGYASKTVISRASLRSCFISGHPAGSLRARWSATEASMRLKGLRERWSGRKGAWGWGPAGALRERGETRRGEFRIGFRSSRSSGRAIRRGRCLPTVERRERRSLRLRSRVGTRFRSARVKSAASSGARVRAALQR
jgi:hypothetical protein